MSTEKKKEALTPPAPVPAPAMPAPAFQAGDADLPHTMFAAAPAAAVAETKKTYWLEARYKVARTAFELELTLSDEQLLLCSTIVCAIDQDDDRKIGSEQGE